MTGCEGYGAIARVYDKLNAEIDYAFAVNKSGISLFNSVPCVVTVHCIKSACNRCNRAKTDFINLCLYPEVRLFAVLC